MARIVTYTHRTKRPPRKKQAVALTGPAVVSSKSPKQLALLRAERRAQAAEGREADPEVKAFLARMIRPGGSLPPEKF